jgi:hypothetical protein
MVEEAYYRLQKPLELPLVKEWGRWEGVDRNRNPLEIDIASRGRPHASPGHARSSG